MAWKALALATALFGMWLPGTSGAQTNPTLSEAEREIRI